MSKAHFWVCLGGIWGCFQRQLACGSVSQAGNMLWIWDIIHHPIGRGPRQNESGRKKKAPYTLSDIWSSWSAKLLLAYPSTLMFCLTTGPEKQTANQGWKLWSHGSKLSCFGLFFSGILSQWQKTNSKVKQELQSACLWFQRLCSLYLFLSSFPPPHFPSISIWLLFQVIRQTLLILENLFWLSKTDLYTLIWGLYLK